MKDDAKEDGLVVRKVVEQVAYWAATMEIERVAHWDKVKVSSKVKQLAALLVE